MNNSASIHRIPVKYHNGRVYNADANTQLCFIGGKSNWIDLRATETVEMKRGDFKIISLGVSMNLGEDYEAHIVPRSSTFRNFGVLQTNGMGVIDSTYCGDDDVWGFPALAMRDTIIHEGDRICQFRIMRKMDPVEFVETNHLSDKARGGFGSTGVA